MKCRPFAQRDLPRKIAGVELASGEDAVLRKMVAALLLALVASPFTAPFATCDMTTLFRSQTTPAPVQVQLAWTMDEDAHAVAPGSAAVRRVRVSLRRTSQAIPEPAFQSPAGVIRASLPIVPVDAGPQPSRPSLRALRI